jgi:hypothetical protein
MIRNEILDIIRTDVPLRRKIADYLGVSDSTVYGHAVRKAPKLNDAIVVEIIKKHTGKSLEEIFTDETIEYVK